MKTLAVVAALLLASPALAQEWAAPDKELWEAMKQAIADVSAPAKAHATIAQILQSVEQQAAVRAAQRKATSKPDQP